MSVKEFFYYVRRFLPDLTEALLSSCVISCFSLAKNIRFFVSYEGIRSFVGYIDDSRHWMQRPGGFKDDVLYYRLHTIHIIQLIKIGESELHRHLYCRTSWKNILFRQKQIPLHCVAICGGYESTFNILFCWSWRIVAGFSDI
mgnify:CR=1 FL=1